MRQAASVGKRRQASALQIRAAWSEDRDYRGSEDEDDSEEF